VRAAVAVGGGIAFPELPAQPGFHKRRRRLSETIEWLVDIFASGRVRWLARDREALCAGRVPAREMTWSCSTRHLMRKALAGDGEEAPVAGDPHDRLGDAEADDLGVCGPATGVARLLREEIVGCAIKGAPLV